MRWLSWLKRRRKEPSITDCPNCGREMVLIDRTSFTGDDMRTYRCERCGQEHIVNFGMATWKGMSNSRDDRWRASPLLRKRGCETLARGLGWHRTPA